MHHTAIEHYIKSVKIEKNVSDYIKCLPKDAKSGQKQTALTSRKTSPMNQGQNFNN